MPMWPRRRYVDARGTYRVFNAAEYRFYRSNSGPPLESDTPFATSATLPYEPTSTYADGIWYVSMSYFNGVIDSGFLPVGPKGETYLRLDIVSGEKILSVPGVPLESITAAPGIWWLELRAGGVVRVNAIYDEEGTLRGEEWAIAYTTGTSDPPSDNPAYTPAIPATGLAVLAFDLPAQSDGTQVNVRLQTRRLLMMGWQYSDDDRSDTQTAFADAVGPTAPLDAELHAGRIPEDLA